MITTDLLVVRAETTGNLQVLGLFKDIADDTLTNEPENRAYFWVRKSKQNTLDGPHLYGLEVYVNLLVGRLRVVKVY